MLSSAPAAVQVLAFLLTLLVTYCTLYALAPHLAGLVAGLHARLRPRSARLSPPAPPTTPEITAALVELERYLSQQITQLSGSLGPRRNPAASPPTTSPPSTTFPPTAALTSPSLAAALSPQAASSLAQHRPTTSRAAQRGTRPVRHTGALTGFKIGVPLLSLDRERAALRGLTRGRGLPYGLRSEAACIHDPAHAAPVRGCECGFHAYLDAHGAWSTWLRDHRAAVGVMLEVGISGRFIRYERGIRFQTQQLRTMQLAPCPGAAADCGRPSELLVYRPADLAGPPDPPSPLDPGVVDASGWIRLRRRCLSCVPAGWGVVGFQEYAELLGLAPGALTSTAGALGADRSAIELLAELQDLHTGPLTPPGS